MLSLAVECQLKCCYGSRRQVWSEMQQLVIDEAIVLSVHWLDFEPLSRV